MSQPLTAAGLTLEDLCFRKRRDLLVSVLKEPHAWPVGYERLLLLEDGALLCSECCRKKARRVMSDVRGGYDTGWLPAAACHEACAPSDPPSEWDSCCGHCGKPVGEVAG